MQAVGIAAIRARDQIKSAVAVEVRQLRTELSLASPLGDPTVRHLVVEPGGCARDASPLIAEDWEDLQPPGIGGPEQELVVAVGVEVTDEGEQAAVRQRDWLRVGSQCDGFADVVRAGKVA